MIINEGKVKRNKNSRKTKHNVKPMKFINDIYLQNIIKWNSITIKSLKIKMRYLTVFYNNALSRIKIMLCFIIVLQQNFKYRSHNLSRNNLLD